jgi:predicted neuraminidase
MLPESAAPDRTHGGAISERRTQAARWLVCLLGGILAPGGILGCWTEPDCEPFPACSGVPSEFQGTAEPSAATVTESPRFAGTPIPTDSSAYPYNHAASIVELPGGDLLVAWGAGSGELAPDTVIVAARRRSGETPWSAPQVVADVPDHADSNPVLFVDDAGTLWLFHVEMLGDTFCLGRVVAQTSTDGGETWSTARPILDAPCVMIRHRPIILRTGRWVLPAYTQGIYQTQFWVSDDRGQNWRPTQALLTFPNNLQPAVVELDDGGLLALMRTGSGGGFTWQGHSCDGGESWSLCKRRDLPNPDSGLDLIRLAGGQLVSFFNNSPTERSPLAACVSLDGGRTWPPPRTIEGGPPQLSYPSAIQTADGTIHVVYSHRLEYIQHAEFNLAWLLDSAVKP